MSSMDNICPTKVAVYIRWSTDDQGEGTTLDVQRDSCIHYLKSQGWEYREALCFIDDGYSGGSLDRPAMKALRKAVADDKVDCVVVYKLDRLSRSVLDTVNLVLEEWEGKCHIKSTREPIDTTTPAGKMFFYMLVSYAEWERSVIRDRLMSGKKKRAEQGKNPGIKHPFGYKRGASAGEWAIAEEEAAIVTRVFHDYAGGKGILTIAGELNQQGILTRTGTLWRASSLLYMLKNPVYKGVLVYGARTHTTSRATGKRMVKTLDKPQHALIEDAVPAIVSAEIWDSVQGVHATRALAPRRCLSAAYLLSGIAKCRCGASLVGSLVDKRYRTYSCTARRAHGRSVCDALFIQAEEVEQKVVDAIRSHYSHSSEEGFIASALVDLAAERDLATATLKQWDVRQGELKRRLHRLHADYDAGQLAARLYNDRVQDTEMELNQAREEVATVQARLVEIERRMRSIESIRSEFRSLGRRLDEWSSLSLEEQKQVLRHAIESLVLWCTGKTRNPENRRKLTQDVEVDLALRRPKVAG